MTTPKTIKIVMPSRLESLYDTICNMHDGGNTGISAIDVVIHDTKNIPNKKSTINHYNKLFKDADFMNIVKRNRSIYFDRYEFRLYKEGHNNCFQSICVVNEKGDWFLGNESISTNICYKDNEFLLEIKPRDSMDIFHNRN